MPQEEASMRSPVDLRAVRLTQFIAAATPYGIAFRQAHEAGVKKSAAKEPVRGSTT